MVHEFFTFCGKILDIDLKEKTATISFEKPSAAKTALMLKGVSIHRRSVIPGESIDSLIPLTRYRCHIERIRDSRHL